MDRIEEYNIECMLINDNQAQEDELIKEYERNSMDRLISEQAVFNVINRYGTDKLRIKAIKAIPSAEPTTDERKKALRELKQEYRHHQYNNSDSCYGWSTSFKQAVAVAIKYLSADEDEWVKRSDILKVIDKCIDERLSEPKWIPVSERLPEIGYSVLVTQITDNNCKYVRIASYQGDCWMDNTDEFNKPNPHKVIAWQPLSKPYDPQEGSENKSCDNCKWNKTEKCQPSTCAMIGCDGHGLWDKAEVEPQEGSDKE